MLPQPRIRGVRIAGVVVAVEQVDDSRRCVLHSLCLPWIACGRLRWNRSRSAGWALPRRPRRRLRPDPPARLRRGDRRGVLDRPYEFVLHPENGLPTRLGEERDRRVQVPRRRGLHRRRRRVQLRQRDRVGPLANELQVPLISWCGTERFQGDYCFRLGNGDVGGDAALVVAWLKRKGYERVAVLSEISPNGEEYFRFFRQECRRRGIVDRRGRDGEPEPDDLADNLDNLRQVDADALVYMGYGMLAARGCCARRSTSSAGTRPASWAPRSCST